MLRTQTRKEGKEWREKDMCLIFCDLYISGRSRQRWRERPKGSLGMNVAPHVLAHKKERKTQRRNFKTFLAMPVCIACKKGIAEVRMTLNKSSLGNNSIKKANVLGPPLAPQMTTRIFFHFFRSRLPPLLAMTGRPLY